MRTVTEPEYRVLSSDDRAEWLELTDAADRLDIAYHPDYVRALESLSSSKSVFGGEGHLFVYGHGDEAVLYPFMLKPLSAQYPGQDGYDLSSPYGYSGPACVSARDDRVRGFRDAFDRFCRDNGVVTEFYRIHPLLPQCEADGAGTLVEHGPLVYIDLLQDLEHITMSHSYSLRRSMKYARGRGVTVRESIKDRTDITTFMELYNGTMERNDARPEYFFPESFYRSLASMDEATLLVTEREGTPLTAGWFLAYGGCVQYFLSGSSMDGRRCRASGLIFAEAISRYKSLGMRYLFLGGGHGSDGGLLDFKLSISPTTVPFRSFRKVHNQATFTRLCADRNLPEALDGYFPPYWNLERERET